jgi:hypothetical protein
VFLVKDDATERRVFWSGFGLATVLVPIAVLHRGLGTAVAAFVAIAFTTVLFAYARTDYLKIGQKVYTASSLKNRPPSGE